MGIIAFGDIHGEFHKLKTLVDRLLIKEDDTLVFLGDYIDRGKHVFETVDYLIKLSKKHKCVFLLGNHEQMFIDFLSGIHEQTYYINGGTVTIKSYEKNGWAMNTPDYMERKLPREHITFFQKLKRFHVQDNFVFVHAGVAPGVPLEKTSNDCLLWDRNFCYEENFQGYDGKTVVFGHTPNNMILNEEYKVCIDTGACFMSMGDLTCVKLPERVFVRQGAVLEDLGGADY